jgi:arginyl-tRNA synthetase
MNFIKKQELYLKEVLEKCGYMVDSVNLVVSSRPDLGEYQYNGAMGLAKTYHKNPRQIAEEVVEVLKDNSDYVNVNIAGPGFINISFSKISLVNYINDIKDNVKINMNTYPKKKIFLDYGGPNVAKVLHVGHLRSPNIGEALKRLCNLCGFETVSDVHLGDWGRPLGLVILEIKKRHPDLVYFIDDYSGEYPKESPVTNDDLIEIYPYASLKAKEDLEYLEEARIITKELQEGKRGYMALWKHIINTSVSEIKKIYEKLNISFDLWEGESDCYHYLSELIDYLNKKNVVVESEGAKVIDVSKIDDVKEVPPLILIKSNGSASYESTDLAGIWERVKLYNPDEIWYVVDKRQELHFEQVFRAAYKSEIASPNLGLYFIGFGTMNGYDGKPFKTRDGGVMTLSNLIDLVIDMVISQTKELMKENISLEEKDEIAEKIAIAALKYADLSPDRSTDYIFDPVKFCNMTGKTGPYLLYSTIRIKSLLDKADNHNYTIYNIYNEYDKNVILNILDMPKCIDNALNSKSLNDICEYLYKLSNSYNNFYSENRILTEEDEKKKCSWLTLSKVVYDINILLLDTLGIEVPSKM